MIKKLILSILLYFALAGTAGAFYTGTLIQSNFWNNTVLITCNAIKNKCYYLKTWLFYKMDWTLISWQSTQTYIHIFTYWDFIYWFVSTWFIFKIDTNNDTYSQVWRPHPWTTSTSLTLATMINNILCIEWLWSWTKYYYTFDFSNNAISYKWEWTIWKNALLSSVWIITTDFIYDLWPYNYKIDNKRYSLYWNNLYSKIWTTKTNIFTGIPFTIKNYNIFKFWSDIYISYSSTLTQWWSFLFSYKNAGFLGNRYYQTFRNTDLLFVWDNDYQNQMYNLSSSPVNIPVYNVWTSQYDMYYIAKDLWLYYSWNFTSGTEGSWWGGTGGSNTTTGTGGSTTTIEKSNQYCTWVIFSVPSSWWFDDFWLSWNVCDTSWYPSCWSEWQNLWDVYESTTKQLLLTPNNFWFTFWQDWLKKIVNSETLYVTWISSSSILDFSFIKPDWFDINKITFTTSSWYNLSNQIRATITDINWNSVTVNSWFLSWKTYQFAFSDYRIISNIKFEIYVLSTQLQINNIKFYWEWDAIYSDKLKYKCTFEDYICDWIDYETPKIKEYCQRDWDYNFIKSEYLKETETTETFFDFSPIIDGFNSIKDSLTGTGTGTGGTIASGSVSFWTGSITFSSGAGNFSSLVGVWTGVDCSNMFINWVFQYSYWNKTNFMTFVGWDLFSKLWFQRWEVKILWVNLVGWVYDLLNVSFSTNANLLLYTFDLLFNNFDFIYYLFNEPVRGQDYCYFWIKLKVYAVWETNHFWTTNKRQFDYFVTIFIMLSLLYLIIRK